MLPTLSKNTGVGCHFLLQGVFPTQGSNLHLLASYSDRLGEDGEMLGLKCVSSGDLGEPQALECNPEIPAFPGEEN